MSPDLLLSYYGDDFTGSTDALEALTSAGVPTVLFLEPPDAPALARFPGVRAVGLAGQARGKSPAWMRDHLTPALASLARLGAPLLQYKICSTFDSSPLIGSIGCAIDLGVPLMPGRWTPMVVGAPRLRRYQAFGHLFAVADGEGYRLDRHPTMAHHPVTPMHESDLRRHLAAQTSRPCELIDFTRLKRADGAEALQLILQKHGHGVPVVLLDVLDEETLREAGRLVWEQRGQGVFSASSSGLEYALAAHWQASGLLAEPAPLLSAGPAEAIAVVSGSCSPVTAAQITCAAANGFATQRLDVGQLLTGDQGEISRAVEAAVQALSRGLSPLVFTALGPDDPAVQAFDGAARAAGLGRDEAAQRTGQALAQVMRGLLDRCPQLRRVVVAGGDSSGAVASVLGIQALSIAARLAPGAPLCRATSRDARRDGLELVLKGGQMGAVNFFVQARDGASK
ncbi:3-oxo-isoapionate kinase OiaK [Variovorax sp. HJSM1_2]|uniref:3-oxo-isoapionate kinase OiaK n=1 Tax=Variovorax sp. HJSM1_2 TaxID=3366263 RepID=UPI003BDC2EBC